MLVEGEGAERERLDRRVSWTPGAEGAPRVGGVDLEVEAEGVMRRACGQVSVSGLEWLGRLRAWGAGLPFWSLMCRSPRTVVATLRAI